MLCKRLHAWAEAIKSKCEHKEIFIRWTCHVAFSYSSLFIPRLVLTVAIKTEPKILNIAGAMA